MFGQQYKDMLNKIFAHIKQNKIEMAILLIASVFFSFMYFSEPTLPGLLGSNGWLSYFDQGAYLKQATKMAEFNLQDYYVYGPGYTLLAVPFIWLGLQAHAFFFINLFSFVFVTWATFRFVRSITNEQVGAVAAFALMFATPLVTYTTMPWSSTVTLFCLGLVLFVASRAKLTIWGILLLSLAGGLAFASRYIDIVWIFGLAIIFLFLQKATWKQLGILTVTTFLLCVPVFWSHYVIFGSPLKTPYVLHTPLSGIGPNDQESGAYSLERIPGAAYGMLVSPQLAGESSAYRGLMGEAFWLIAAFGLPFVLKSLPRKQAIFIASLLGFAIIQALFYLSFRASGAAALQFGTLHYFKMFWPVLAICAVITIYYGFFKSNVSVSTLPAPHNTKAKKKVK